jgi:phospholipid/cholesterol/gamma-HCH transport system permease protein
MDFVARLGAITLDQFRGWGHAAYFTASLLRALPTSLRRFGLVVAQIYAIGNRSLIIIAASGLAVGFVLALQMYYALVTYGAAESLGLIVNLALVRELGPVVTGLLFAGRAGTSLTAEIGLPSTPSRVCWHHVSSAASFRCPSWRSSFQRSASWVPMWWRCC